MQRLVAPSFRSRALSRSVSRLLIKSSRFYSNRALAICCLGDVVGPRYLHTASVRRNEGGQSIQTGSTSTGIDDEDTRKGYLLRVSLERLIQDLARQPVPTVTLNDLLRFRTTSQNGKNKESILVENANDTLRDLFVLIGRSIKRFTDLPYIVLMNPHMAKIYQCYTDSLELLLKFVDECKGGDSEVQAYSAFEDLSQFRITTPEQNERFIAVLSQIFEMHTDNTLDLRDGFDEVDMRLVDDKEFLNMHMRERILMRLLTDHHLLLNSQLEHVTDIKSLKSLGAIDMNLNVLEVLNHSYEYVNDMAAMKYADRIELKVKSVLLKSDGTSRTQNIDEICEFADFDPLIFPYITNHLEYVFDEILKNSTRASMDNNVTLPVEVLVVLREPTSPDDCYKLDVRITDYAKGIKPEVVDHLFDYAFTTVDEPDTDYKVLNTTFANVIAGMGYGLPMSLTYTRLFNGDIFLKSIYGQGTTVYLQWRGIDGRILSNSL
ncbi:DEKNAAC100361 [Brettanomyces naardenensis]|uniref:Protein-serine/threonine kinase n=1 Tax=Brettanomyces naardenensis TaxID=13370 RepID=A0A448YEU5_BRENA|nr:DEKNAAC100361 [Brettanomyces naardenensis]